jgi:hypothetical protein
VSRIGTRELIYINRHAARDPPGELSVLAVGRPAGARHRATALTNSQTQTRVTRLLAEFTDGCPAARGLEAAEARLDGAVIDLTE